MCADAGIEIPSQGGAALHFQAVAEALARAGHEVVAVCTAGSGEVGSAARTVRVAVDEARGPLKRELASLGLNTRLATALAATHRDQPLDGVLERYSLWSYAAAGFCERERVPLVLEVNAPLIDEQKRHRKLVLEGAALAIRGLVASRAKHVFAVSDEVARDFPRAELMPNGVDLQMFRPGSRGQRRWGFVAGFVGGLRPWHDLETIAAASEIVPSDISIVVAGDGPGRAALEGASRIRFLGPVAHDKVPAVIHRFDAGLVTASRDHGYLSPLKLPEYLACGLPVIVAAGSQGDLELEPMVKETYQPGDAQSLAAAIMRLRDRANDPRIAIRARSAAEARSWDAVAARIAVALED
jgi:alpha-maltose-1-phosphate synthase